MNLLALARSALNDRPTAGRSRRHATPDEAKVLRALVREVLADAPHEWDEVIAVACADAEAALECFGFLAEDSRDRAMEA